MTYSTASPLVRRIWDLPIPAADRARAAREFERAERLVDNAAQLVGGLRRRLRGGPPRRLGRVLFGTAGR